MAKNKLQQTINDLCKKIKNADHGAQAELLAKITDEIEQFVREENGSSDATDGAFDVLSNLVKSVQEDFEELIDADSVKKIYKLLINTNVNTIDKIKRILKIAIERTLKTWQGPRRQ